uniref:uncharacterized protein LOC122588931 n=1 Tax=Erigeron canadensis TaxID=72917 RepID=UPI001CB9123B|nr:uncharacterized protein LOC122588931 [Erigeron canadensis]
METSVVDTNTGSTDSDPFDNNNVNINNIAISSSLSPSSRMISSRTTSFDVIRFLQAPVTTILEYSGVLRPPPPPRSNINDFNESEASLIHDHEVRDSNSVTTSGDQNGEVSIRITGSPDSGEDGGGPVGGPEVADSSDVDGGNGESGSHSDSSYQQRYDMQQVSRWVEQILPFSLLLLIVFIRQHLQGFFVTIYVTAFMYKSNDILRKQTALKGERRLSVLGGYYIVFVLHVIGVYWWYQNDDLCYPLFMVPPKVIPPFWHAIFTILVNDTMVRQAAMAFKLVLLMYYRNGKGHNFRRQGQMLTLVEYGLLLYRAFLPAPVWYRFFLNKEYGSLFSSLTTGLYLTFKLTSIVEKVGSFWTAMKALSRKDVHYGSYATPEQVLEAGDLCAICQEKMQAPVLLRCKHIFCEDCVSEWFERERTCPLCRAVVKPADLRSFADGSTSLFFQLFVALVTIGSFSMSLDFSSLQGGFQQSEFAAFDSLMDAMYDPSSNSNLEIDENDIDLLSVSWNQDYGCFAAGTNHGFRIYNCDPFKETFRRDLKSGGFGIIEMLFRSNILALVGGKGNTQYPPNKVIIWDDHQSRCIGEFSFRSDVRAVKLRRDRIVVVLEHKIYVYNFMDLKLLHQIETIANPRGLCCLSHQVNTSVLACPGLRRGQVRVEHFGLNMTKLINAHDSRISCLTMTMDGLLLATASTKGTLIRIFNTMDGTRLQEVRRGVDRADIYGISLSSNVQWLAVSSDKGTVHIFSLRVRVGSEDSSTQSTASHTPSLSHQNSSSSLDGLISPSAAGANPGSSLSFMKGVLPKYFSSEWSFAQFHLPECTQYMSAFGSQNSLIIVGMDGSFYRCIFDPVNGGEMVQHEYVRFLKTERKLR